MHVQAGSGSAHARHGLGMARGVRERWGTEATQDGARKGGEGREGGERSGRGLACHVRAG